MEKLYCPYCGKQELQRIEICEEDNEHTKESFTCSNCDRDFIVYIYNFFD